MYKKRVVVLTGAGVSAESGISTFRDSNGLWENHDISEVATPEGWERNPSLVLEFYNQRRRQLKNVEPNAAHYALAKLEEKYNVTIITQNVDNLHERAGSSEIIHLHGELTKAKSSENLFYVVDIGYDDIHIGDLCDKGHQLRPHVVWFGEPVPKISEASKVASLADIFIVVGTSLVVYPAAGLIEYVPPDAYKYIIDPVKPAIYNSYKNLTFYIEKATTGTMRLVDKLLKNEIPD
jgi:NAD-dependent deacetylase